MRLSPVVLAVPALFLWHCSGCGSESGLVDETPAPTPDAAAAKPDTGSTVDSGAPPADGGAVVKDATVQDANDATADVGVDALVDTGPPCVADATCNNNPGAPCRLGAVVCNGDGGISCVDGAEATDGTSCTSGLCTAGACLPATIVSANKNLSTESITPGRTCAAEAPAFSVTALAANQATVSAAPTSDCLVAGDEVLLVSQQGAAGTSTNVGNWESLTVASVSGTTVTFTTNKTRSYGTAADAGATENGIGTGAGDQKVALLRVPHFGDLTVNAGTTLTAAPWNGQTGGIVALRAAKLTVNGTITAAALGYRDGRWSKDDSNCTENVATETGESFTGPAVVSTTPNGGAAGGIAAAAIGFNNNTPMNAGASHATVGGAAKNANGRTLGAAGAIYGANDGSRLTLGSGAAGNLTCDVGAGPTLIAVGGRFAGGAVALSVGQLDVGASGVISARAIDPGRDTPASGGTVLIRGKGAVNLGTGRVVAVGATAPGGSPPTSGQTVTGGDGYVIVSGSPVTGASTPAANVVP